MKCCIMVFQSAVRGPAGVHVRFVRGAFLLIVVFTLLQFSYSTERYKDLFVLLIYSGHDGNQGTASPMIHR